MQYSLYLTGQKSSVNEVTSELYPNIIKWIPSFVFTLSGLSKLPDSPYWKGRFSNGPVSFELVAQNLRLPTNAFVNYAHGGSTILNYYDYLESFWEPGQSAAPELATFNNLLSSIHNGKWLQVSVKQQAAVLLKYHTPFNENDVVIISGGANDYLNQYWESNRVVQALVKITRSVLSQNAGVLVWGTVPDITRTPCLMGADSNPSTKRVIQQHNRMLDEVSLSLRQEFPEQLLLLVDNAAVFEALLIEADMRGMNTKESCSGISFSGCYDRNATTDIRNSAEVQPCPNPDDYFFWDSVHTSSRVNRWINSLTCYLMDLLNINVQCTQDNDVDPVTILKRAGELSQSKRVREQIDSLSSKFCPVVPEY